MTPYLLRRCDGYASALRQATLMMANRGFDALGGDLRTGEKERALAYARQAAAYFTGWLFPIVESQLRELERLGTARRGVYAGLIDSVEELKRTLAEADFAALAAEDPRHLFLLASSLKYPALFRGRPGGVDSVPVRWQRMACSTLKMCHIIKTIEEDSQDINDFARLGLFLESRGNGLEDLYDFNWDEPDLIPDDECARRAFVRLSMFFHKLSESISWSDAAGCWIFDSGDGVRVQVAEVKARLKSPESMFAKLGRDAEEEAHSIRDVLAITFLLRDRDDSLTLFHALQKRGVILQEYTLSTSITQTLYDDPSDMEEAVRRLMVALARSGGSADCPDGAEVASHAEEFFQALSMNAVRNPHASDKHRKFQCKITYPLPIHRETAAGRILVPGTAAYAERDRHPMETKQFTVPVELRISDLRSWEESEQRGDAHHQAYKFRQLIALMNRLFDPVFRFPEDALPGLREDQGRLFM